MLFAPLEATVRTEQKKMKSVNAWLSEVLHEGAIGSAKWTDDGLQISTEAAYSHYGDWSKDRIEYRTHAKNSWVREIKKIFGPLVDTEHRESWNVTRYLRLAALEKCRGAFQTYARIPGRIAGGDALAQSRTLGGEPHQRVAFYEVAPAAACNR
jgi:hypothetical protein